MILTPRHVDDFLEDNEYATETRRLYRRSILAFIDDVRPGEDGWELRVRAWKRGLHGSPKTRQITASAARVFLDYCVGLHLLDTNPLTGMRVKARSRSYVPLLPAQIVALMDALQQDTSPLGLRDRAIATLMLTTGLRSRAVCEADVEDAATESGRHVLRYRPKGHQEKDSLVVLQQDVIDAIDTYIENAPDHPERGALLRGTTPPYDRLTTSGLYRAIRSRFMTVQCIREAMTRGDRIVPHSLRHSAATLAEDAGASLEDIRDMLGHDSVKTTEIYIHRLDRLRHPAEDRIRLDDLEDGAVPA